MKWVVDFGGFEVELGGDHHVPDNMHERKREIIDRSMMLVYRERRMKEGVILDPEEVRIKCG